MCSIFTNQDPATYAAETRPMRLHGHATSIRLEAAFWDILEAIAAAEGISLSRFVAVLHDEILARNDEVPNFASFLRVTCLHWLRHRDAHVREIAVRRQAPVAEQDVSHPLTTPSDPPREPSRPRRRPALAGYYLSDAAPP